VRGFVADDAPPADSLSRICGRWLGSIEDFLKEPSASHYVVGIGTPKTRRSVAERLDEAGLAAATLVHPAAAIGADVELGEGTVVCSHVSITTNIRLGRHVHVNLNSTVGHDSRISDFVTINPLVAVSGDVTLEEEVTMGTHSSILQGLRVGAGSFVGAGAVVVKHVPAGVTVVGVPAKPLA
jgi:sugar O-acyltransferase (sialic acid O-acetyltransferase NeuD family)